MPRIHAGELKFAARLTGRGVDAAIASLKTLTDCGSEFDGARTLCPMPSSLRCAYKKHAEVSAGEAASVR